MAPLAGHHPTKRKVAGSIPGQGTCLSWGFGPWLGCLPEATDPHFSPSLSPSLERQRGDRERERERERCIGQGMWEGLWSSHALFEHVTLPKYPWVHQLEAVWTLSFEFLWRLHYIGVTDHELHFQSFSLLRWVGDRAENSKLLIMGWSFWWVALTQDPPRVTQEINECFRSSVSGTGGRDLCVFLIINHNIVTVGTCNRLPHSFDIVSLSTDSNM